MNSALMKQADETFRQMCAEGFVRRRTVAVLNNIKQLDEKKKERICLAPLLLEYMFWKYGSMAVDYSAQHRLSDLKKHARNFRGLEHKYYVALAKVGADKMYQDRLHEMFDKFLEVHNKDLFIMYLSVQRAVWKFHPDCPHTDMVIYAMMARYIHVIQKNLNKINDDELQAEIGLVCSSTIDARCIAAFNELEWFIGDYGISDPERKVTKDVGDCMEILLKKLKNIA